MAAPMATHSSGLMPLKGSLPVMVRTMSWTQGIRLEPPTRMTLSIWELLSPASCMAFCTQALVLSMRSEMSSLNLARVMVMSMFLAPEASMAM